MIKVSKRLIEETRAIVRFYLFLRYECGLREAERLSARELRELIFALKTRQEKG